MRADANKGTNILTGCQQRTVNDGDGGHQAEANGFVMVLNGDERWRIYPWCPEEDSNLHGFHHWYLKPARLPIPPPGLKRET